MAGVWQPRRGGHGERGLPNFCFISSGGFASSGMTTARPEQPCETLRGSVLRAQPPANPGVPLHPQGTQMVPKLGEKGDRLGREVAQLPRGSSWVRGCAGSMGRASVMERLYPTSPPCWLWELRSSRTPRDPQRAQVWVAKRDKARRLPRARGVPRVLPWGLLSAGDWGPAQLHHPGWGGQDNFGGTGQGTGSAL